MTDDKADARRFRDLVAIGVLKRVGAPSGLPLPTKDELMAVADELTVQSIKYVTTAGADGNALDRATEARRTLDAGLLLVFEELRRMAQR